MIIRDICQRIAEIKQSDRETISLMERMMGYLERKIYNYSQLYAF